MRNTFALIALLLAAPVQAGPLWEWEIEAAFVDRAFAYEWPEDGDTQVGIIAYRDDRKILIRGAEGYRDAGTWRVQGDRLCMAAAPIQDGREACVSVEPIGDKYVTGHGLALLPLADIGFLDP